MTDHPAEGKQGARELSMIAADCHRSKWEFDVSDENPPTATESRKLVRLAFDELHRIGNKALDASVALSQGGKASATQRSELDDASNACLELAAKHGFATGHGDTVADMIREFSAQIRSPAESVIKPTDANISVLAEALYHCGCPAGGMTVGECAEQGVCGCTIRSARIKGCMGTEHQSFPRDEQHVAIPSTERSDG